MSSNGIKDTFAQSTRRQPCDTRSHAGRKAQEEMRLDDLAAAEHRRREALRQRNQEYADETFPPAFKAGVSAWKGGQEGYAARLGIARSTLVEMCNGERTITARDFLPLREQPGALTAFLAELGGLGRLLITAIILPTLTFSQLERDALDFLRRNPDLWRTFVEEEKRRRPGVTEQEIEVVYERGRQRPEQEDETPAPEQQHAPVMP